MVDLNIKNNTIYSMKELNELSSLLTDVIMGDAQAAEHPTFIEKLNGNNEKVQLALDYLLNNPELNEVQKSYLVQNSWKILYTSKPPTPEEFLTEKYLGRAILSTYPRIKDIFKLFFSNSAEYRDLILYPHIGFGKEQPVDTRIKIPTGIKTMGELTVGDTVVTPNGGTAKVIAEHPQGKKDVYELEFADSRTAQCGLNHIWRVSYSYRAWENVETKFILENPDLHYLFPSDIGQENGDYKGKVKLKGIKKLPPVEQKCITLDSEEGLYVLENNIITHNSYLSTLITLYITTHLSLMRDSKEYFGLSPASIIAQGFISYSIEKTSELLLEPFLNILAQSPYFERVRTADKMRKLDFEWKNDKGTKGDNRIYWTTAAPSSALSFSNGANIKIVTNPSKLLGINFASIVLSEISFFLDAGKALVLETLVETPQGKVPIGALKLGDTITHPFLGTTPVVGIPYEGTDDAYEITFDNGKKVECNLEHLWLVNYTKNGKSLQEVKTTRFILENMDTYSFSIPELS